MVAAKVLSVAIVGLQYFSTALACPDPSADSLLCNASQPHYPCVEVGDDAPADVATTGYFQNHMALNVNNLTASLDFYTKIFGFRVIFNYRATSKLSIVYMGHSHGGRNGSAYQTVSEMNRLKNNQEGLLELVHYDNPDAHLIASTSVTNTFSHIGIIVPDVNATQARLEAFGARILKGVGDPYILESSKEVLTAYGLSSILDSSNSTEAQEIIAGLTATHPENYIFVADPDGNYLEIEPLDEPQLPI